MTRCSARKCGEAFLDHPAPPQLRKLAGFHVYKKLMGHIDKCSPLDLLDGCAPRPVVGT